MSILNLSEPPEGRVADEVEPPRLKRAWLAFALSLVVPGAGQMYAGRFNAGLWTMLVFLPSLLVAIVSFGRTAGGYGLYFAFSLYIYGFLDAYFSVLEANAGIAGLISGSNPRTAATLNFMTNGFGYFYLGERAKGVLMFLGMGVLRNVLNLAFPHSPWLLLFWSMVQVGFAWDAWRIARRQLLQNAPELAGHSWRAAAAGQMPPVLPVAVAVLLTLPFVAWLLFGIAGQGASGIDVAGAHTTTTGDVMDYSNPRYRLHALFPAGWVLESEPGRLAAHSSSGACRMILLREYLLKTTHSYMRSVDATLSKKEGYSVHDRHDDWLDGRPAAAMEVSVGTSVTEQLYFTRAGRSLYTLNLVANDEDAACAAQLDSVKRNLHFAH